jgi:hypothetical protein
MDQEGIKKVGELTGRFEDIRGIYCTLRELSDACSRWMKLKTKNELENGRWKDKLLELFRKRPF